MIRKIVLENYMAHIRTVIEPAQGLTVLIGPNNCGKSAIIHALEMICYNSDAADYAIRHGAKKAVVTIETQDDDGMIHTVSWWRKVGTAGYTLDGREISKLGKGKIPDDLHQYLRMPMIESAAGGDAFQLHFGLQKSPIFLVDDSPGRKAQFFASSTDADKLMQMQKAHQQKATDSKRDKAKLDAELDQLDRQLQSLASLPDVSRCLGELESDFHKLNDLAAAIGAVGENVRSMERVEKDVAVCASQINLLLMLQKPPTLPDTRKLAEWIDATESFQTKAAISQTRGGTLLRLTEPPQLSSTHLLRQMCDDIDKVSQKKAIEQDRTSALARLASPPTPHDVPAILKTIDNISTAENRHEKAGMRFAALASIAAPPGLPDTSRLREFLDDFGKSGINAFRHQIKCDALKTLIAVPAMRDVEDLKKQIAEISRMAKVVERVSAQSEIVSHLAIPLEPMDLQPVKASIDKIDAATRAVSESNVNVQRLSREIEQFQREIEKWVQQNPRCTACGQAISAELITSGGHSHE
jgi:energy-coupling factor transporter ATP-binding protein EcfA2